MTDAEFLDAFEACRLQREDWTHAAHLRVAWLCASAAEDVDAATRRVRVGIQRLNTAFGTPPDKYHETVTVAFMRIVSALIVAGPPVDSAAAFLERHPELSSRDTPILHRYYSQDVLDSREAHETFVAPDRDALPEIQPART